MMLFYTWSNLTGARRRAEGPPAGLRRRIALLLALVIGLALVPFAGSLHAQPEGDSVLTLIVGEKTHVLTHEDLRKLPEDLVLHHKPSGTSGLCNKFPRDSICRGPFIKNLIFPRRPTETLNP